MKITYYFKRVMICMIAAALVLASGCRHGGGTSSGVSSGGVSSKAPGGSSEPSADSKIPENTESAETSRPEEENNGSTESVSSKIRENSLSDPASYEYGRSEVSSDWNKRFNISTGFAITGDRAMCEKIVSQTKDAFFTTIEITSIDIADPDPDGPGKEGVRNVLRTALDVCRKYKIGAYLSDPYLGGWGDGGRNINESHVAETMEAYKDYEDIIQAYVLWDEPFVESFPEVRKRYDWVRKYNKNVRLFMNLFPSYGVYGWGNTAWASQSYTEYVDSFISQVRPDMLSLDYYAFDSQGENNPDVLSSSQGLWRDMGYFRKKALETNLPFEFYIQAAGRMFDPFERVGKMTSEKISFQMWASLAYGVTRVSYWTSYGVLLDGNGDKTPLYNAIQSINKEGMTVGQFLYDKKSENIYHSGVGNLALVRGNYFIDDLSKSTLLSEIPTESIVSVFSDKAGGKYIMIANKDYAYPTEGRLVFRTPQKLSKFNAAANRLETPSKVLSSIEMKIPAGGYALYKIV